MNTIDQNIDFNELNKEEHKAAEILRLRAGYDGCACAWCQETYRSIDLSMYGDRVLKTSDTVSIAAGRKGADLWDLYHPPDPTIPRETTPEPQGHVSKLPDPTEPLEEPEPDIKPPVVLKHPGGRPRKEDGFGRVTDWRRRQEIRELQGVLIP